MSRFDDTPHSLRWRTWGQTLSERLSAKVIAHEGYTKIDPIHPTGGPDGGADATCVAPSGDPAIMAVYFPVEPVTAASVESKVKGDLKSARENGRDFKVMAFVTNQKLTQSEREAVRALGGDTEIDLFHLERVAHILDLPEMKSVRERFLSVASEAEPLLVSVEPVGSAIVVDEFDVVRDVLADRERKQLSERAQAIRDGKVKRIQTPPRPSAYYAALGIEDAPDTPPPPPDTEADIDAKVERFVSRLDGHRQESLDYLAAHTARALHFRIKNDAKSFLKNVQVIITLQGVAGVDVLPMEAFRLQKYEDKNWVESRSQWEPAMSASDMSQLRFKGYPVDWRNVDGGLRVTITLPELRPTPPWDSTEEAQDDVVVLLRDFELTEVSGSYTVTAETYGEVFEDSITVPVERISARTLLAVAFKQHDPLR